MNWITLLLISINLLFGYLVFQKMNKSGRHLLLNRWYLILLPILSIVLGMIHYNSGGNVFEGFQIELPLITIDGSTQATSESSSLNWLLLIYLTGSVLSFLHLLWSFRKIRKPSDTQFLNQFGKQRIYLTSENQYSYSHFNNIYISEYQLDNVEFIVKHELAHAQQKHSFDILFIRLLRCLFWFNPIIYLWEARMKENHEYLADQVCIVEKDDIKKYSYALLSSHLGVSIPELANGFNQESLLRKRIIQLKSHNTFNMKKLILIPVVIAGTIMTMSLQLATETNANSQETATAVSTDGKIDSKPEFVGGMEAMITYFQDNIIYPKNLAKDNIEDKVFVKFKVSEKGEVSDVSLAKGSEHDEFNEEAIRVVSIMPDWKPGMKDGKPVSSEMTLPIQFKL